MTDTKRKTETSKYNKFIGNLPQPGGGGAHTAIFQAACMGARAGLTPEQVIGDIKRFMPEGTRQVTEKEITEGVRAGFADALSKPEIAPVTVTAQKIGPSVLKNIIADGRGATEADIAKRSPVPIDWAEEAAAVPVLEHLYGPDENLFIGDDQWPGGLGSTINPARIWRGILKDDTGFPKIMVNPLTGQPAAKKSGNGLTFRGDNNIEKFRFVVAEFDGIPLDDQLAFWMAVPHLPVAALIFSGKKSIHAWLRVDCVDRTEWETEIEKSLFPEFLQPLGLDPACKNESRLSRLPGHKRADTGLVQRCFYLAPQGKAVSA